MKTRKRKIGIEIIRTAVVDVRRNLIIGLVALLTGIFALPASAQCEAKNDAFQSDNKIAPNANDGGSDYFVPDPFSSCLHLVFVF